MVSNPCSPLIYLLGLLQEDVVEDPRDINVDIVLHGLENVHVGLHGVEELAGLGNLAGLLAVHDHAGKGAGESRLQVLVQVFAGREGVLPYAEQKKP